MDEAVEELFFFKLFFFKLIPILALLSNLCRENCLSYLGTEGVVNLLTVESRNSPRC